MPQFTKTDNMFGILREDKTAGYQLNTLVLQPLVIFSFVLCLSALSERRSSKVAEYDLDELSEVTPGRFLLRLCLFCCVFFIFLIFQFVLWCFLLLCFVSSRRFVLSHRSHCTVCSLCLEFKIKSTGFQLFLSSFEPKCETLSTRVEMVLMHQKRCTQTYVSRWRTQ